MNILTITGYKDINDVNIGDYVLAFDTNTGDVIQNTLLDKQLFTIDMLEPILPIYDENGILESEGKTSEEVFVDTYGEFTFYKINNKYKLFRNQSIWVNDNKVIHASQLQIGDVIFDDDNNDIIINSIEETTGTHWYKLTVSGDHSFISDGIQLHNASRYWSGNRTSVSLNWNYTTGGTNWGSASGVADDASVPTSTDDVTFNGVGAKGNANSTLSSNITVGSVTFTSGYTALITINSSITLTIAGSFTDNTAHNWVVGNGSSAITISATSTITSNGKTFPGIVNFTGTNTKTLVGDWTVVGRLSLATTTSTTTLNGSTFILSVGGYITNFNAAFTGNAILRIGGSITMGGGGNNVISITQLQFAGNFDIPTFTYAGTLLKYISGTITSSGTLILNNFITFDTAPIVWANLNLVSNVSGTYTINSLLQVSGTMQMAYNGATVFAGSAGWTVGTLTTTGSNGGLNFNNTLTVGNVYTITSSLNVLLGAYINSFAFVSSDATNRVKLILQQGATCLTNIRFTRIDASDGRTINTWYGGSVNDCINVRSYTDLQTVSSIF